MTPALDISAAQTGLQQTPVNAPHATQNVAAARKAAQQFESVFVSEFLGQMFEGISTDGPFGGGQGEAMFRSLMLDEYGKQISAQGGFGLSAAVTRQLLQSQERTQ
jgi:peptidoglycan hydrolase FlgJ